jgi:hypothetical protein
MMFEGEVGVELISPFYIRYNPEAKSKDEATEYYHRLPDAEGRGAQEVGARRGGLEGSSDEELEMVDDLISSAAGATEILGMTSLAGDRTKRSASACS